MLSTIVVPYILKINIYIMYTIYIVFISTTRVVCGVFVCGVWCARARAVCGLFFFGLPPTTTNLENVSVCP